MRAFELASKAYRHLLRTAYRTLGLHPTSDPYISGDSFRALARHRLEARGNLDGERVADGDIVFVEAHELRRFAAEVAPKIRCRFVLVSHNGDDNIDETYASLAEHPMLIRWFAQNLVFEHPKIQTIPIGLENRWRHDNGVVRDFDRLRSRPRRERKLKILYAFNYQTNRAERLPALEAIKDSPYGESGHWSLSSEYRPCLAEYGFVLSPPGNGFDCHRTWEALYLGVVPIVKRSALFDGFPGLPVIQVDDWNEMRSWDGAFLERARAALAPRIGTCPSLWMDHWKRIIEACTS